MDSLKTALLSNTFSFEAAKRRVSLLQRALESVFYTASNGDQTIEERYRAAIEAEAVPQDVTALSAWGTEWLSNFSEQTLHDNMALLNTWLGTLPRITVYVPALLDSEGEAVLGTWCRQELSPEHLIDFEVDATTLGGCALIAGGKLFDYSFSTRLRKIPGVISDVLDSYAST